VFILDLHGDLSGARIEAWPKEGAHGETWFPHGSAPKARDGVGDDWSEAKS
jgi:hypothetical protein